MYVAIQRFIPAHAENTAKAEAYWSASPVHPRARGEHERAFDTACRLPGSSSRTRRTRDARHGAKDRCRFIPAHAENTCESALSRRSNPVHPRARGEHRSKARAQLLGAAKTVHPRARGEHRPRRKRVGSRASTRFIPAHAENTSRCAKHRCANPVHPRARGEHGALMFSYLFRRGSSPRTRRTQSPGAAPQRA